MVKVTIPLVVTVEGDALLSIAIPGLPPATTPKEKLSTPSAPSPELLGASRVIRPMGAAE